MKGENYFEGLEPIKKGPEESEKKEKIPGEEVEAVPETEPLDLEELKRKDVEKIERVQGEITQLQEQSVSSKVSPEGTDEQQEKIKEYQENYLPSYLREPQGKESLIGRSSAFLMKLFGKIEIPSEEKENLPEKGPFLVIVNHFGGETPALLELFKDYDTHIAAAKEVHWKRSPIRPWLLRKMRMISVEESLVHLSLEEKEELLKRVPGPKARKEGYARVIEREKMGQVPTNIEFIRQSVALLSRGDVVAMYPEGLILYGGEKKLNQGYGGLEVVIKEYKKVTGKELPIVPVGVFEESGEKKKKTKRVKVGKPLLLSNNKTELSGTDWCMSHLARLLPEEQRGYYRETAI